MNRTEKEDQHYVPKFYLRNFSVNNNKKQIGVFNVKTNGYVPLAKLKTQACKSFFYGVDGKVEDNLSILENLTAPIISKMINSEKVCNYDTEEYMILLTFAILMQLRNPIMANVVDESYERLTKQVHSRSKEDIEFFKTNKVPNIHNWNIGLSLSVLRGCWGIEKNW
ncbi:DUF4238 domain-containing protein [Spirosoma linguale]|uniref:DUF4238 domain-containing protein n=1 Tax=Spirosoma linguale (strain ATCC 33905 / DSM 74 / LMG 10896 / Claus 1) TaxID=504472 RepID=D2QVV4_SPILD|nr:hypothetical protein Slin_6993 [Spirosoma linguale DSM 74]